jgi:2-desacetyl-2-hydroxyethyl bacteriochlorophyllide A dehydrogenase
MGHETVGTIDATGDGVDRSRVGERVVLKPILTCGACAPCMSGAINLCPSGRLVGRDLSGGFAEMFAIPAHAAVALPDVMTDDIAVLTEPLANAVHVTSRSVDRGAEVLVIGSGPIGVLMARTALYYGAWRVLVTDPVSDRLRFAEAQGAEAVRGGEPAEVVREATGGLGVDLVIDAAGFEATWALGLRAVRAGGRICQVGLGAASGDLDYLAVVGKEATIAGSYGWTDDDFARAIELLAEDALDPARWITRIPLADGQRAFEELVDGSSRFKVLLEP